MQCVDRLGTHERLNDYLSYHLNQVWSSYHHLIRNAVITNDFCKNRKNSMLCANYLWVSWNILLRYIDPDSWHYGYNQYNQNCPEDILLWSYKSSSCHILWELSPRYLENAWIELSNCILLRKACGYSDWIDMSSFVFLHLIIFH